MSFDLSIFDSINEKRQFIKSTIENKVSSLHNPLLIDSIKQPNDNIIYKLFSDGTITREKGGWAYGNRSMIDLKSYAIKPSTFFMFPLTGINEGDTYAIMTLEDCQEMRDLIDELFLQLP
jgi:hypothetical protein